MCLLIPCFSYTIVIVGPLLGKRFSVIMLLPIITNLSVENYGLFPAADGSGVLECEFKSGMTLIVGVNGLGKTTLMTMILRSLTGPYDLTSTGLPASLESVLPESARRLQKFAIDFFSQRVADQAKNAKVTLGLKFGSTSVQITRALDSLYLEEFFVGNYGVNLPQGNAEREAIFQQELCKFFDLSSFVDVLLVLHHIIFLSDRRSGALWDENAQRQILRAIFLDKKLAKKVADTEREFQRSHSRYRNTKAQVGKFQRQLDSAITAEKISPKVRAKLEATASALEGYTSQAEVLEERLDSLNEERKFARLQLERAKIENEQASGAIEHAKYSTLMHMFPQMDDAARLLVARIMSDEGCLVCGAEAEKKKQELEDLLKKGFCPACGSDPAEQRHKVQDKKFQKAKMGEALKAANVAEKELQAAQRKLEEVSASYGEVLSKLVEVRAQSEKLRVDTEKLSVQLPASSAKVKELRNTVDALTKTMDAESADSVVAKKKYGRALASSRDSIISAEKKLTSRFSHYSKILMSEEARLSRIQGRAKITQSGDHFDVPAFVPEMTAADRPGLTRRQTWNDVSESQRELIDLAFRLALIDVSANRKSSTFLMETPEASLDGVAMDRVGKALNGFATSRSNRLIVTSNLTNAGMITAMFGGEVISEKSKRERWERVVNLLDEAAPNQALMSHREQYDELLNSCLTGK